VTARKAVPGTQRAHVCEEGGGILAARYLSGDAFARGDSVLVIPESAVSGCEHGKAWHERMPSCEECGSFRTKNYLADGGFEWTRWQRPKILRVGRVKR